MLVMISIALAIGIYFGLKRVWNYKHKVSLRISMHSGHADLPQNLN